jgi:hypothetical protein
VLYSAAYLSLFTAGQPLLLMAVGRGAAVLVNVVRGMLVLRCGLVMVEILW